MKHQQVMQKLQSSMEEVGKVAVVFLISRGHSRSQMMELSEDIQIQLESEPPKLEMVETTIDVELTEEARSLLLGPKINRSERRMKKDEFNFVENRSRTNRTGGRKRNGWDGNPKFAGVVPKRHRKGR